MLLYGCYGVQGWLTWHCNVVSKMLGTLQEGSCSALGNCYWVVAMWNSLLKVLFKSVVVLFLVFSMAKTFESG